MKLRLWPWGRRVERTAAEPAADEPVEEEQAAEEPTPPATPPPAARPGRPPPAPRRPGQPASAFARPYAPETDTETDSDTAPVPRAEPPATVSLTVEEAKAAIRAAGGDVIQIGFLANAYRRQRAEEPAGKETAAARKRLSELVAKRLRDRKLLGADGRLELLEEPPPHQRAVWPDGQ